MRQRKVILLGATGSIGASARKVARCLPGRMKIVGMSGHTDEAGLAAAAREFPDAAVVCSNCEDGSHRLVELATMPEADLVLVAIVGTAGLAPTLAAIEAGKDIAVASKEILVLAGEIVMEAARRKGVRVLPIDSEHNAIFQCLEGRDPAHVKRLILTCSGGPFRTTPAADLASVVPEQALRHPTWSMGRKISIDSATLFNKALEMIEARWLFDVEMARIDVVVHPQSTIHSLVEFVDGSMLAQLSRSDMCFPIQYAVTWPDRVPGDLATLDLAALGRLDFEAPREDVFPALRLARESLQAGGTMPGVLNAANEVAVEAFLARRISFPAIAETVDRCMQSHRTVSQPGMDSLLAADAEARRSASEVVDSLAR